MSDVEMRTEQPSAYAAATRRKRTRPPSTDTEPSVVSGNQQSEKRSDRTRITISLSERTMRAFDELKELTDADTDSEVFRNALRLHQSLLRAHIAGDALLVRRKGSDEIATVFPFIQNPPLIENITDNGDDPDRPGVRAATSQITPEQK